MYDENKGSNLCKSADFTALHKGSVYSVAYFNMVSFFCFFYKYENNLFLLFWLEMLNSSNNSVPPPANPNALKSSNLLCFSFPHHYILLGYFFTFVLTFLPLCTLVLYHGLHKWKQARSASSAAAVSHSDYFTFHIVLIDLIGVLGCTFLCGGIFEENSLMSYGGAILWVYTWYGETSLHVLTCMERHMAVVHPIAYMKLRNNRGVRIRNIVAGCVWLFGIVGMVSVSPAVVVFYSMNLAFMTLSLIAITFCSLSVLHVLVHPSPGAKLGEREKVDPTKKKAFYTIVAILVVLVLRFIGNLAWTLIFVLKSENGCFLMVVMIWFTLPSSLMQPLLFLHREGKLTCFLITF